MEARIARLEGIEEQIRDRLSSIDARFDSLETRIDMRFAAVDARFTSLDGRFTAMDARLLALDRKIDSRFFWILGVLFSTWITTMLAIVRYH